MKNYLLIYRIEDFQQYHRVGTVCRIDILLARYDTMDMTRADEHLNS